MTSLPSPIAVRWSFVVALVAAGGCAPQPTATPVAESSASLSRADLLRVYETGSRCYGLGGVAVSLGNDAPRSSSGRYLINVGTRVQDRSLAVMAQVGNTLQYSPERIAADQQAIFGEYGRETVRRSGADLPERIGADLGDCDQVLR